MKTFIKKSFIVFLFATAFMFLVGDLIHIGDNTNNYVNNQILYDLDYPQTQLNNYSLREVFENRNVAKPNLNDKEYLDNGIYRLHSQNGGNLDYNIYNGHYRIHGMFTGVLTYSFGTRPIGDYYAQIWEVEKVSYDSSNIVFLGGPSPSNVVIANNISYQGKVPVYSSLYFISIYKQSWDNVYNIDVTFKVQLEQGTIGTPYQIATNGPYNNINIGTLNLTTQQIDYWFEIYNILKGLK